LIIGKFDYYVVLNDLILHNFIIPFIKAITVFYSIFYGFFGVGKISLASNFIDL